MKQGLKLPSPLVPNERVKLIHHNELEVVEERRKLLTVEYEQSFKRFRSDEENASGLPQQTLLMPCIYISMPAVDRYV